GRVLWYGLSPAADVWAKIENIDAAGTRFALTAGDERVSVVSGLIGRHNVYNCLGAAAAAMELGVNLETVAAAMTSMDYVPGRLQRVDGEVPYKVFVDYAHTDDALANVLSSLRPLTGGRIILVFGCGGDRDRSKRQRMAKVGQDLADRLVITSDNPRSEDPQAIIDQIVAGLSDGGRRRAEIEPDRRAAIALAIDMAQEADVVLVAGKGHENYQIIGSQRLPFDDVKVAAELIGVRRARS
ncbi:MAG: UDP-N-acetylmuramoyl-L-alanyl-D-glutamate--2,6-diaminopimelate ligase, partial [Phycisphaerae bacterium]|nr:UDP-N-acetylmuramoyl-L-alanyl-D-glutamate--2,6-diaminopimelate ligase [Phycisphaerae bacterium]